MRFLCLESLNFGALVIFRCIPLCIHPLTSINTMTVFMEWDHARETHVLMSQGSSKFMSSSLTWTFFNYRPMWYISFTISHLHWKPKTCLLYHAYTICSRLYNSTELAWVRHMNNQQQYFFPISYLITYPQTNYNIILLTHWGRVTHIC